MWEDPWKKPCYLFALVAGDLAMSEDKFRTMSGRDVTLRIYVQAKNLGKVDHAMVSLKHAMKWDEDTFGEACSRPSAGLGPVCSFAGRAIPSPLLSHSIVFSRGYLLGLCL